MINKSDSLGIPNYGKKLRCPMSVEEINKGIELGMELRKEQMKVK